LIGATPAYISSVNFSFSPTLTEYIFPIMKTYIKLIHILRIVLISSFQWFKLNLTGKLFSRDNEDFLKKKTFFNFFGGKQHILGKCL